MARDLIIVFAAGEAVVFNRAGDRVKSYRMTNFSNIKSVAAKVKTAIPARRIAATYLLQIHVNYDAINDVSDALEEAGFEDFETINSTSFVLTQVLLSTLDLKCRRGQLLHVIIDLMNYEHFNIDSYVLRRTAKGYDIIDFSDGQNTDVKEELKKLKFVLIAHGGEHDPEEKYKKLFPHKKRMYTNFNLVFMHDYMWNKYDGGNLDGYLVSDAAGMKFSFVGFTSTEDVHLESMAIPGTRIFDRWFKQTDFIDVNVMYKKQGTVCNVERLELDDEADYKVRITIEIDEGLVPCVDIEVLQTANKKKKTPTLSLLGFTLDSPLHQIHMDDRPIAVYTNAVLDPLSYFAFYKDSIVPIEMNVFDSMEKLAKDISVQLPVDNIEVLVDAYSLDSSLETRFERAKALEFLNVKVFPISYLSLNWTRIFMANKLFVPVGQSIACWDFSHCFILVKQSDGFRVIDWTEANFDILDTYGVQTVVITRHFNRSPQMITAAIEALHPRTVHFFEFNDDMDANAINTIWKCADDDRDSYFVHDFANFKFTVKWAKESKVFETGYVSLPHEFSVELDVGEALKFEVSYDLNGRFTKSECQQSFWDLRKLKSKQLSLVVKIRNAYDVRFELKPSQPFQPCTRLVIFQEVSNGFTRIQYLRSGSPSRDLRFATLKLGLQSLSHPELTTVVLDVKNVSSEDRETYSKLVKDYNFLLVEFVNDAFQSLRIFALIRTSEARNCPIGEQVFLINSKFNKAGKEKNVRKEPSFDVFVVKRCMDSFRVLRRGEFTISALRSDFPYARRAVVFGESEKRVFKWLKGFNTEFLPENPSYDIFFTFADDVKVQSDLIVKRFLHFDFEVEWEGGWKLFDTEYQVPPFSSTVAVRVTKTDCLTIKTVSSSNKTELVSELKFDSLADGIVVFTLAVDEFLIPSTTLVRTIRRAPSTILEMTADNRVVIHSKNYKGRTEFPAYVSFKEKINVGDSALEHLKSNPELVVYDVTKLLNIKFDLYQADPKWKFTTSRSDDGDLLVHLGDITCPVHMLFAYIVKATFLAVQEQVKSEFKAIGIQLPDDCAVSEDWRKKISDTMGVDLVVFN